MARRTIGTATVQYDDAKGTIAVDGHDGAVLFDFAKAYGIETEKYFPFHVEFYVSTDFEIAATFYAADRETQGNTFDELIALARAEQGALKLVTIEPENSISLEQWSNCTKRLEISIGRTGIPNDIELYVVDD